VIVGRSDACRRIEALVVDVRAGSGDALVLSGPAGIGKTTLLEFAEHQAPDFLVLRTTGSPAERGLPYAALSQVLAPILTHLPMLPPVQQGAIRSALGLDPPIGADAFPVYAGTLGLLAAAAAERPVAIMIDDGQWSDTASIQAVLFAQRRLIHDPVALMLATRADHQGALWADLPVLEVTGLAAEAAHSLLRQHGMTLDEHVLDWLVRSTGGNPLALLDVPTYLPSAELALRAHRAQQAPIGPVLTAAYGHAMATKSPDQRQALVIAAMLDGADIAVLAAALASADLDIALLGDAEDTGMVRLSAGAVQMRHPLTRSAVIASSPPTARRAAHRACAEGLRRSVRPTDAEARVWHLADAALGPDEEIAAQLEDLAHRATGRTGDAAACLTNQRAAELSAPGEGRTRRLIAAAAAGLAAGLPADSQHLLTVLEHQQGTTGRQALQIAHLQGRVRAAAGDPPGAARELRRHALASRRTDPDLAVQLAVDSAFAAVLAGDMELAAGAGDLIASVDGDASTDALADLIIGTAMAMGGSGADALPRLDRCRAFFDIPDPPTELLQQVIYLGTAYSLVNRFDSAIPLLDRGISVARRRGALGVLPFALAMSATTAYRTGDWNNGYARACEAAALAEDTGQTHIRPNATVMIAQIDAARGRERARGDAEAVIRDSSAMGATFIQAQGLSVLGLLELSRGDPAAAIAPLRECGRLSRQFGLFELGHLQWAAELIEAEVRCGITEDSPETLEIMRGAAHPGATTVNRALLLRCEAMLAADSSWEDSFREALALHGGPNVRPFEVARTELCFGERLRRRRRRKEAREHLSRAWETFTALGATTWAARAGQEIAALGGQAPGPVSHVTDLLTPQELQVAVTVAGGATNREVAGALFLSHKTVEFHLSNIYRRLGLRTRAELVRVMRDRATPPESTTG
jgi:DNA-binding CsgD family transcriptional regulator